MVMFNMVFKARTAMLHDGTTMNFDPAMMTSLLSTSLGMNKSDIYVKGKLFMSNVRLLCQSSYIYIKGEKLSQR